MQLVCIFWVQKLKGTDHYQRNAGGIIKGNKLKNEVYITVNVLILALNLP